MGSQYGIFYRGADGNRLPSKNCPHEGRREWEVRKTDSYANISPKTSMLLVRCAVLRIQAAAANTVKSAGHCCLVKIDNLCIGRAMGP